MIQECCALAGPTSPFFMEPSRRKRPRPAFGIVDGRTPRRCPSVSKSVSLRALCDPPLLISPPPVELSKASASILRQQRGVSTKTGEVEMEGAWRRGEGEGEAPEVRKELLLDLCDQVVVGQLEGLGAIKFGGGGGTPVPPLPGIAKF